MRENFDKGRIAARRKRRINEISIPTISYEREVIDNIINDPSTVFHDETKTPSPYADWDEYCAHPDKNLTWDDFLKQKK